MSVPRKTAPTTMREDFVRAGRAFLAKRRAEGDQLRACQADENTAAPLDLDELACVAIREAKTESEANAALLVALRLERLMTEGA